MKNDTNCKIEVWKDINGYEDLYEVSSFGRVKSLGNGKSNNSKKRILKLGKHKSGYLYVDLIKDGNRKTFRVHRLVAENFIPNPLNLPEVNHKDENKENNFVENLEFCNRTYNVNYGTRTEKCSKKVYQYTKSGEFVKEWKSTREIKRELGYFHQHISKCCNGKPHYNTAYGYIWSYNKPLH